MFRCFHGRSSLGQYCPRLIGRLQGILAVSAGKTHVRRWLILPSDAGDFVSGADGRWAAQILASTKGTREIAKVMQG